MKQLNFKGESVSELGIGTWNIGEGDARQSSQEITAIQYGLEHGINFIDTAEMYGEGKSETLVGQAIQPMTGISYLSLLNFTRFMRRPV